MVEEVKVAQRAAEKRFTTIVQLLAGADDEPFVRISYTTDGVVRRGPVTLKVRDLERVLSGVAEQPRPRGGRSGLDGMAECARRAAATDNRAASTSEPRISAPSAEPSSGSTACSGCGIRPKTFPRSLQTPATSATAPFGFSPGA